MSGGGTGVSPPGGGGTGHVLPPYPPAPAGPINWFFKPGPVIGLVAPRETLEKTARSPLQIQMQLAAENAPIRFTYGEDQIGALVVDVLQYAGNWVFVLLWGQGPAGGVQTLYMDAKALPAGVTATHYTGAAGQTADATLVAAYAAQSPAIVYADTLDGLAYSVVTVPPAVLSGAPAFTATFRGRLLYNPDGGATAYSDNPSLALRDFITSTTYGLSKTATDASVIAAAAANDALVGGAKRRTIGLTIDTVQRGRDWLDTMATYAGCWVVEDAGVFTLVPDRPRATDATVKHADGNILALHELGKRGVLGVPTVVDVRWTDTSVTPWRERSAVAKLAGVDAGTTPRRESVVRLPGIHTYAQAYREAVERLNKLNLGDLTIDLTEFDRGIAIEVGDVREVTYPDGLTDKAFRVMGISGENGRYRWLGNEYAAGMYSDAVESGPSQTDTNLPSPQSPPAVTGLTLVEELYQLMNGTWSSRLRAAWTAADSPFITGYRVELVLAGEIVDSSTVTTSTEYATPPVQEGAQYTVRVYSLTTVAASSAATQTATPAGKSAAPGDVPSITGFEAGGTVYLSWEQAVDIDVWRYELRWGLTTDTWDDATLLDIVDALRYTTKSIPVGTWKIFVKCLDSIQPPNKSANAATVNVTVTLDAAAFLVDEIDFDTPTLTRMSSFTLGRTDGVARYVTEDGVAFATKFPNALGTYGNPLASYSSSGASSWKSETHDFGQPLAGDWRATMNSTALSGSVVNTLKLSADDVTYDDYTALSAKAQARYAKLWAEASGTDVILLTVPTQHVRIDAIPREENFADTSLSTGPKTLYCANFYSAAKDVAVSPSGTSALIGVYDNVGRNGPSPSDKGSLIVVTGNTITHSGATTWHSVRSKHAIPAGVWYAELKINAGGSYPNTVMVGLFNASASVTTHLGLANPGVCYYGNNGNRWLNGSSAAYGATFTTGDVIGMKIATAAGTVEFFKNNSSQGVISGVTMTGVFLGWSLYYGNESVTARIKETEWSYAAPSGASPLPYAFDAYVFNTSGTKVANAFTATFKGY